MSVINSIPLIAAGDDGYQISRSVRLRSSASAYFNKTFSSSPTNRNKVTFSCWAKITTAGGTGYEHFISAYFDANNYSYFRITNGNQLSYSEIIGGTTVCSLISNAVYRDYSGWYHFMVVVDTTQAVAANRNILYVNGQQVTSFATQTNFPLNQNIVLGYNTSHNIGQYAGGGTYYYDGYLTEVNFIDGQALTPSSFGETDTTTGVWKPKKYAGTYGTNGFYLNFSDNSAATAAAIGKDNSGNGNNWTPNNISVTAGVTYDSMIDSPTNSASASNYCTLNPLDKGSSATLDNGNLRLNNAFTGTPYQCARASFGVSSGKWYWEVNCTTISGNSPSVGVATSQASMTNYLGADAYGWCYVLATGAKGNNGNTSTAYGASVSSGDVVGVALDMDAGTLTFYKNNTSQSEAFSSLSGVIFPAAFAFNTSVLDHNFGQRPFAYTPPTGFKALNTQNLPDATIKKGNAYFDATTYTGTGASQNIVNAGAFQPDLVWAKRRNSAADHALVDSVRGAVKTLFSSSTAAEDTTSQTITAFNSNGFTVGNTGYTGAASDTYVGWQWKESASAGFDIVTYTGTGANRTISHSLGVAPKFMFGHIRNTAGENWFVYHANLTSAAYRLRLNTTDAQDSQPTFWNSTAPTSSVFSVGTGAPNVSGYNYVMYLFAEVAGFSAFGKYTGNGSTDGPFVFTNFRPKFVLMKRTDTGGTDWIMWDSLRNTYNVVNAYLAANLSDAETTAYTNNLLDFVSNGFKVRQTASGMNASGGTYIYAAFAENPFKNSLAR